MAKKKTVNTVKTVPERRKSSRRDDVNRRTEYVVVPEERRTEERRKTTRRRQIDPTTCERDYSNEEIEFMHAMDNYKRDSGRMFPTCSEILEVVRNLGYEKSFPQEIPPNYESKELAQQNEVTNLEVPSEIAVTKNW